MANHDDDDFGAAASLASARVMASMPSRVAFARVPTVAATVKPASAAIKPASRLPIITVVAQPQRTHAAMAPTRYTPRLSSPSTVRPPSAALILPPRASLPLSPVRMTAGPAMMPTADEGGGGGGGGFDAFESQSAPPEAFDQSTDWTPPVSDALTLAPSTIQTMTVAPKESFWKRLLALFGIGKKPEAKMAGEGSDMASLAGSVVRRARNGDQNAMALIALVRDNAKAGYPQAQAAFSLMERYIRQHPVEGATMHGDVDGTYADAVALSHGPLLTNPRIGQVFSSFGAEEQLAMRQGMNLAEDIAAVAHPVLGRAMRMGRILGEARRLQAVRQPNSSLSRFDARVGWELGE